MMADTLLGLKRPAAFSLSRVGSRLSFLYLDRCAVAQDDNGTRAFIRGEGGHRSVSLPIADLTALLLGPGTSVTQQAAAACARTGCAISFVGAGAVRSYGSFTSPYAPTDLLMAQARIVADDEARALTAKAMYVKRFPGPLFEYAPPDISIDQLRGMEGARVKAIYQSLARKHRLKGWRRNKGDLGALDPVNVAINHANTCLYGIVSAVVLALGLSPGLGVIHQGNRHAFVLDIADLYKAEVTLPLAFALHASSDPGRDAMVALRSRFTLLRLLPRIVDDIYDLLGQNPSEETDDPLPDDGGRWVTEEMYLWAPEGSVESGRNWDPGLLATVDESV